MVLAMINTAKNGADAGSVGVMLAAFMGYLPDVAALLTVVWLAIRVYETQTVQNLLKRWRTNKKEAEKEG